MPMPLPYSAMVRAPGHCSHAGSRHCSLLSVTVSISLCLRYKLNGPRPACEGNSLYSGAAPLEHAPEDKGDT